MSETIRDMDAGFAENQKLKEQVAEAQQVCWEAHQHIGGSLVQEMPEQDSIAIMDKLCNVINKAKEQS